MKITSSFVIFISLVLIRILDLRVILFLKLVFQVDLGCSHFKWIITRGILLEVQEIGNPSYPDAEFVHFSPVVLAETYEGCYRGDPLVREGSELT